MCYASKYAGSNFVNVQVVTPVELFTIIIIIKSRSLISYQHLYMVAYFCHHLSDHYVDLSENYVDLTDNKVDLSDIKPTSRWQLVALTGYENKILS